MSNKSLWDEWESINSEIELLQMKLTELVEKEKVLNERLLKLLIGTRANTKLTRRQYEVLSLTKVHPVLSNKEIANKLNISERTVKFHIAALLKLYDVQSRFDLRHVALTVIKEE